MPRQGAVRPGEARALKQVEDALSVHERVVRTLAAEDRFRAVWALYDRYHPYDRRVAILADLMLEANHHADGSAVFELDLALAEHVAGVKIASGRIPRERRWAHARPERSLRGLDEKPLPFDYGRFS